jgi:hypothetical protein
MGFCYLWTGSFGCTERTARQKNHFIHRQHQTQAKEITAIFKDVMKNENINFVFSFKYAQAHVYSSVNQIFHQNFVKDIQGENLKTLWTFVTTIFSFQMGSARFCQGFHKKYSLRCFRRFLLWFRPICLGREFLGKNSTEPREIEIVKHWYQWMCWGRLGYNPDMGNDRFVESIQSGSLEINAQEMFDAWQSASMIYPWVTGFTGERSIFNGTSNPDNHARLWQTRHQVTTM